MRIQSTKSRQTKTLEPWSDSIGSAKALLTALVLTIALAACNETARDHATDTNTSPAVASGEATEAPLLEGEHPEAYVTQVLFLAARQGAKLYSVAGGDPAVNGLYTYIAVAGEPPESQWRVFQIGDFNSWTLEEDRGDAVVLAVSRSWLDERGDLQTADERLIVSVPQPSDTAIFITPAR
jgi:hypothetical protein